MAAPEVSKKDAVAYAIQGAPLLTRTVGEEYRKKKSTSVLLKGEYINLARAVLKRSIEQLTTSKKKSVADEHSSTLAKAPRAITDYLLVLESVLGTLRVEKVLQKITGKNNLYALIPLIQEDITKDNFCKNDKDSEIVDTTYTAKYPLLKALVKKEMKSAKKFHDKNFQLKIGNTIRDFLDTYGNKRAADVLNERDKRKVESNPRVISYNPHLLFLMLIEQSAFKESPFKLLGDIYKVSSEAMKNVDGMDENDSSSDGDFSKKEDSTKLTDTKSRSPYIEIINKDNEDNDQSASDSQQEVHDIRDTRLTLAGSYKSESPKLDNKPQRTTSLESLEHVKMPSIESIDSNIETPKKEIIEIKAVDNTSLCANEEIELIEKNFPPTPKGRSDHEPTPSDSQFEMISNPSPRSKKGAFAHHERQAKKVVPLPISSGADQPSTPKGPHIPFLYRFNTSKNIQNTGRQPRRARKQSTVDQFGGVADAYLDDDPNSASTEENIRKSMKTILVLVTAVGCIAGVSKLTRSLLTSSSKRRKPTTRVVKV